MSILAFDTSAAACSAALWRDGAVIAAERAPMVRGHAEALMPMIERVVAAAQIGYRDLAAVAAVAGPGAFTGLRIGLAAARGIALAAGIPAIGISAFAAIAAAVPEAARRGCCIVVAIDTKRADLYLQSFDAAGSPLAEGRVVSPAEAVSSLPAGALYVTGDGAAALRPLLAGRTDIVFDPAPLPPDPGAVATLAAAALTASSVTGAALPPPVPLYLRAPEATPLAEQGRPRQPRRHA
ncbi:MAG: tRNA (adenosine(37)-N6)-threonylcarbamoyltransferase complex dimerization subunit type 1 TsaB [Rhodospirillaceae bacterium]|nr:tRNA (adenosine(37)-N6)-threonylcarbamoyltransferase complex dimerization subunit type 1 TsaB [Rhodospirillaceae bacterium]